MLDDCFGRINEGKGEFLVRLDIGMENDILELGVDVFESFKCCFESIQGEKFKNCLLFKYVIS